jgi:hypothetical protein
VPWSAYDPDFCVPYPPARQDDGAAASLAGLRQAREAVLSGAAPDAVAASAAEALRKGGNGPVTRREAEAMWDLAAAAEGRADRGPLEALFLAAVASHLLSLSTSVGPAAAPALARGAWISLAHAPVASVGACFARVLTAVLSEDAICAEEGWAPRAAADSALRELAAGVPAGNWVAERLSRAPAASAVDSRLSAFLGELARPRAASLAQAA